MIPEGSRVPLGLFISADLARTCKAALRLKGIGLLEAVAGNVHRPPYPAPPIAPAAAISVLACQILGQGLFAASQTMAASAAMLMETARTRPATRLIKT